MTNATFLPFAVTVIGGESECEGPGDNEGVGDGTMASDFEDDDGDVDRIRTGSRVGGGR